MRRNNGSATLRAYGENAVKRTSEGGRQTACLIANEQNGGFERYGARGECAQHVLRVSGTPCQTAGCCLYGAVGTRMHAAMYMRARATPKWQSQRVAKRTNQRFA